MLAPQGKAAGTAPAALGLFCRTFRVTLVVLHGLLRFHRDAGPGAGPRVSQVRAGKRPGESRERSRERSREPPSAGGVTAPSAARIAFPALMPHSGSRSAFPARIPHSRPISHIPGPFLVDIPHSRPTPRFPGPYPAFPARIPLSWHAPRHIRSGQLGAGWSEEPRKCRLEAGISIPRAFPEGRALSEHPIPSENSVRVLTGPFGAAGLAGAPQESGAQQRALLSACGRRPSSPAKPQSPAVSADCRGS